MKLTPDETCQALGLESFGAPYAARAPRQQMRLLLEPSFHPELCLEFVERDGALRVTAACAAASLYAIEGGDALEISAGEGRAKGASLAALELDFRRALGEPDPRTTGRDGVRVSVFWRSFDSRLIVERANPTSDSALGGFVARAAALAWGAVAQPACRESLDRAGGYLGLSLAAPRDDD